MSLRRTHLVLALVAALAAPVTASAATTFTISGHGYGHGVGMGQYGAQGYALQGWTHQQILAHYYQGTTLGPSGVSQVRVLLQENMPVAIASAPDGITAADEGGTAKLAVPGSGVVKVRKDPGGFTLLDASGTVLDRGWVGPVSLTATGGGPITLAGAALNFVSDGRYRGRLRVLGDAKGLTVVNLVTLESYLLGVVASEMPSDWKPEALETQAIAARSYAVATRKPATSPFDLYPDERSQVYRGLAAEKPSATAAIQATAGQVVLYQGQPIITYFSSSTGGRTAAAQDVFPTKPVPYLVSVDDPYDTISPYHDWSISLSARQLSDKAGYPGLVSGVSVAAFPSGRVDTITLQGDAGPLALSATLARKRLGLRSTWFAIAPVVPAPKVAAPEIDLRARVARGRVLLSGTAPPGIATLQAGAMSPGWRDVTTHAVADDGKVAFRRPLGEASRYRLVAGSLSSAAAPVMRRTEVLLKGAPGTQLHGRVYPAGARGAVILQHVVRGHWVWMARTTSTRAGKFRFVVKAWPGRWRVRWRGATGLLPAISPEVRAGQRSLAWTPTDPLAARQWNLTAVNAFGYADTLPAFNGDAITVAVIDSGIDRTSPDLAGAVPLASIDEAHDTTTSLVHGTAVAGIIAADADNGIGGTGVGVPYVKLIDYRVVSGGDVDPDIEAKAIRDAIGAGARVINLSLGGTRNPKVPALDEFSREERDAVSEAVKANVVVVAAVGNSTFGTGAYASWPAALRHVIGVSAVDSRLAWAPFSNTDRVYNDIAAPGVGIITTVPRSLTPTGSSLDAPPGMLVGSDGTVLGTSFAVPHVTAAAAVLLARHPELTASQVIWILERSAHRLGGTPGVGRDPFTGFGLLDITAAVKMADEPSSGWPPADASEPNDVAGAAQTLKSPSGSFPAIGDFGDDRRDVYKIAVRSGETLRVRTTGLPALGGNLGLDVDIFAPGTTDLANPARRPLARKRPTGPNTSLLVHNVSPYDGDYLVQVTVRRGWGAYQLHWDVTPGL